MARTFCNSRLERRGADCVLVSCVSVGLGKLRLFRDRFAGQNMACLFTGDRGPELRLESDDQADFLTYSSHVVPWHEEVVGMAHLGLAVVGLHLVGPEYVLACRSWIGRFSSVFIEGIDNEVAFDLNGVIFACLVEHDASAKPACWSFALGVADRVDPDRQDT